MPDVIQDEDRYYGLDDFRQGIHSNIPYFKAPRNSLQLASNSRINKRGSLTRRPSFTEQGYFNYPTISVIPAGMIWVGPTATYTKRAVWILGWEPGSLGVVRTYDGSSWGASTTNPTSSAIIKSSMAWARDSSGTEYVYAAIPDGNTHKFTIAANPVGSSLSGATNSNPPANINFILNHLDRLWAAGRVDQNRDKLYYSKILAPEVWDQTNNWISFGGQFGERITAVQVYRENQLVVGTDQAIYLLSVGTAQNLLDWEQILVTRDYGIMSNWTVVNTGDDVMFMDSQGDIRSLQRTIQDNAAGVDSLPISFRIKDKLVASNYLPFSSAVYFDGIYHLFYSTGARSRLMFCYDKTLDIWFGPWTFKSHAADTIWPQFGLVIPVTGALSATTGVGNTEQGLVIVGRNEADNGAHLLRIDALANTAAFDTLPSSTSVIVPIDIQATALDFEEPQRDKLVKWIQFEMYTQSLDTGSSRLFTLQGRVDFDPNWTDLEEVDYSLTPNGRTYKKVKVKCAELGRGNTFQFRIVKSDSGPPFEILRAIASIHVFEVRDN